jgi:hypothetical protein
VTNVFVDNDVILDVLIDRLPFNAETAMHSGADLILTRNIKDFRNSPIPVLTPAQFLATRL